MRYLFDKQLKNPFSIPIPTILFKTYKLQTLIYVRNLFCLFKDNEIFDFIW